MSVSFKCSEGYSWKEKHGPILKRYWECDEISVKVVENTFAPSVADGYPYRVNGVAFSDPLKAAARAVKIHLQKMADARALVENYG